MAEGQVWAAMGCCVCVRPGVQKPMRKAPLASPLEFCPGHPGLNPSLKDKKHNCASVSLAVQLAIK